MVAYINYDINKERFSRDVYPVRDEDVPKVESPGKWFVFEPGVSA